MAAFASTATAQGTAGKGSLGATIGVPFFLADEDTKDGQSPRLIGEARFQYAFNNRTRLAATFGFGWVGYKDGTLGPYKFAIPGSGDSTQLKDELLTKVVPIQVSLLYAFKEQGAGWVPYVGGGAGLTRLEIVNDRQKIKDPATFDSYVNWAPGLQAQLGTEYFLPSNKSVAFDWNVQLAKLFSKDTEQFPSGFTGPHTTVAVNFGVNVYFWPIGHKPIETAKEPAPAPAAPESGLPAPPAPDAPAPPAPPAEPDTTKAPPTPQQMSILHRGAKPAPVAAAATKAAAHDDAPAACPVRPAGDVSSSMFGVPDAAIVPARHDEPPTRHGTIHPEDGPTP